MADRKFNVKVTIWFDDTEEDQDVTRNYGGDYDTLHNKDWNKTMQDFLDDAKKYAEEAL